MVTFYTPEHASIDNHMEYYGDEERDMMFRVLAEADPNTLNAVDVLEANFLEVQLVSNVLGRND
jgi:hypothetical protein